MGVGRACIGEAPQFFGGLVRERGGRALKLGRKETMLEHGRGQRGHGTQNASNKRPRHHQQALQVERDTASLTRPAPQRSAPTTAPDRRRPAHGRRRQTRGAAGGRCARAPRAARAAAACTTRGVRRHGVCWGWEGRGDLLHTARGGAGGARTQTCRRARARTGRGCARRGRRAAMGRDHRYPAAPTRPPAPLPWHPTGRRGAHPHTVPRPAGGPTRPPPLTPPAGTTRRCGHDRPPTPTVAHATADDPTGGGPAAAPPSPRPPPSAAPPPRAGGASAATGRRRRAVAERRPPPPRPAAPPAAADARGGSVAAGPHTMHAPDFSFEYGGAKR